MFVFVQTKGGMNVLVQVEYTEIHLKKKKKRYWSIMCEILTLLLLRQSCITVLLLVHNRVGRSYITNCYLKKVLTNVN